MPFLKTADFVDVFVFELLVEFILPPDIEPLLAQALRVVVIVKLLLQAALGPCRAFILRYRSARG